MERQVLIPLNFMRQRETLTSGNWSGFDVSPVIATITVFQFLCFFIYAVAPSPYVMATLSNMCFMSAGIYRAFVTIARGHSSTFLLGQLAGASFIYVFLGSSSFAFHAESELNSPAHAFDIFGGWLLVLHACFVCVSVSVIAVAKWSINNEWRRCAIMTTHIVLSIILVFMITLFTTFYEFFYERQVALYITLGSGALIFGSVCRFMLVYKKDLQWRAVRIAVFELGVGFVVVFSGILCQGELLSFSDRRLSYNIEGDAYDLYHAHWHYFLALSTSILYARAADAARVVMGSECVCVCTQSWLDVFALSVLLVYSVTAVFLKELKVETQASLITLFIFNAIMVVHAIFVVGDWLKKRREVAK